MTAPSLKPLLILQTGHAPEPVRRAEMEAKAFSPKILKDMEEENKLSNEYSKLTANLTAELDGKSYTLGELTQMEDETDRDSRKKFDALRQSGFASFEEQTQTLEAQRKAAH